VKCPPADIAGFVDSEGPAAILIMRF